MAHALGLFVLILRCVKIVFLKRFGPHRGSSWAPSWVDLLPKIAPRRSSCLPRSLQEGPKAAQETSKTAQKRPKRAPSRRRETPKTASDGVRRARNALRQPKRPPKSRLRRPYGSRRPPRGLQEAPRKLPGGPKRAPRGSKEASSDRLAKLGPNAWPQALPKRQGAAVIRRRRLRYTTTMPSQGHPGP